MGHVFVSNLAEEKKLDKPKRGGTQIGIRYSKKTKSKKIKRERRIQALSLHQLSIPGKDMGDKGRRLNSERPVVREQSGAVTDTYNVTKARKGLNKQRNKGKTLCTSKTNNGEIEKPHRVLLWRETDGQAISKGTLWEVEEWG